LDGAIMHFFFPREHFHHAVFSTAWIREVLYWERIWCSSSTGRVTELYLLSARNEELGDWYLNASLLLPFQELKALNLISLFFFKLIK
jgi:hypothetical protein